MPRYTTSGIPPQLACTAFMPHFNRMRASGAQQYKYGLEGHPGTQGIPIDMAGAVPSPDLGDVVLAGTSRSTDAPDVIFPQLYYQRWAIEWPGAGMPVRIYDPTQPGPTTLLPLPATDYRAMYQQRSARLSANFPQLGQHQIRERPRLPRWSNLGRRRRAG